MPSEELLFLRELERERGLLTSCLRLRSNRLPSLGRINGQCNARNRSRREYASSFVSNSYNSGTLCLSTGDLQEAERFLVEAIRKAPKFEKSWNNLGVCFMRKRRYDKAIECFSKALSIDPTYEIARLNLEECRFLQAVKQL